MSEGELQQVSIDQSSGALTGVLWFPNFVKSKRCGRKLQKRGKADEIENSPPITSAPPSLPDDDLFIAKTPSRTQTNRFDPYGSPRTPKRAGRQIQSNSRISETEPATTQCSLVSNVFLATPITSLDRPQLVLPPIQVHPAYTMSRPVLPPFSELQHAYLPGGLDIPVQKKDSIREEVSQWRNNILGVATDDLTEFVIRDGDYAAHGGGFADIYKGVLQKNGRTTRVAIKVIRAHIYPPANQWKIDKRLNREIQVWSGLRHPNIVPLLGITKNFGPHVSMVCPWMVEGNLNHYLQSNKSELVLRRRFQILVDVVEGLAYLHRNSIVHGDLTSANVLMDGGKACLTDFGLSNVMAEIRNASFLTSTVGGAPRWTAPELLMSGIEATATPLQRLTTQCDVYSFGCVALEVMSGKIPYGNITSDFQVLMEIMKGRPPTRPKEPILSDPIWNLIRSCLVRESLTRPEINQVKDKLQRLQWNCSEEEMRANVVDCDIPMEMDDSA